MALRNAGSGGLEQVARDRQVGGSGCGIDMAKKGGQVKQLGGSGIDRCRCVRHQSVIAASARA
jgi:hypothetical protein